MNLLSETSDFTLTTLLAIISLLCLYGIIKGVRSGKPPFQKGLKGTALSLSRKLMWIQVIMCSLLLLACLLAMVIFL